MKVGAHAIHRMPGTLKKCPVEIAATFLLMGSQGHHRHQSLYDWRGGRSPDLLVSLILRDPVGEVRCAWCPLGPGHQGEPNYHGDPKSI